MPPQTAFRSAASPSAASRSDMPRGVPWRQIVFVYGLGVLAAATLGRFAGLIPLLQRELGLSLTMAAGLTSLIEASGALFGFAAGMAVGRVGARASLIAGTLILTVAGAGQALAAGPAALIGWRALESTGYLAITVAAPTLITLLAGRAGRDAAMALWSTFVPVGLAIGTALAAPLADAFDWRAVPLAGAVAAGLMTLASLRLKTPAAEDADRPLAPGSGSQDASPTGQSAGSRPSPALWLTALGFGLYALVGVGILALTPGFLVDRFGLGATAAGLCAAAASLANIPGSMVAAAALARGVRPLRLAAFGLLAPGLVVLFAFAGADSWPVAAASIVAMNAIAGIAPAVLFGRIPVLARGPRGVALGNGLIAQFGASGSMIGPPLIAASVSATGWPAAGLIAGALSFAAALAVLASGRMR